MADRLASLKAENLTLKELGFKKRITLKEYQDTFKIPIKDFWVALGLDEKYYLQNADHIKKIYTKYYEPLEQLCRTRNGTKAVIRWLKSKNIQTSICSNHSTQHIKKQLLRLKVQGIASILGREVDDNSHLHKPGKEKRLIDYVKAYKFKPVEIISVGDSEEEIKFGKSLGYYTVALTGGWNSTARLKNSKPDFLIHNMKELVGIIKKLNKW